MGTAPGSPEAITASTMPDTYPNPNMMYSTTSVASCKVFSEIDLKNGYQEIPMNSKDLPKKAIMTPFGLLSSPS